MAANVRTVDLHRGLDYGKREPKEIGFTLSRQQEH